MTNTFGRHTGGVYGKCPFRSEPHTFCLTCHEETQLRLQHSLANPNNWDIWGIEGTTLTGIHMKPRESFPATT